MEIYVAGSSKQVAMCRMIGKLLRILGHDVYVFCDIGEPVYNLSVDVRESGHSAGLTARSATFDTTVLQIYRGNMAQLMHADVVVLVLPSGKSAHLEAGFAKGQGKRVYVIGEMQNGDWDAMYCMCDEVFGYEDITQLMDRLKLTPQ